MPQTTRAGPEDPPFGQCLFNPYYDHHPMIHHLPRVIAVQQKPRRLHFCWYWDFGGSKDPGLARAVLMTHSWHHWLRREFSKVSTGLSCALAALATPQTEENSKRRSTVLNTCNTCSCTCLSLSKLWIPTLMTRADSGKPWLWF